VKIKCPFCSSLMAGIPGNRKCINIQCGAKETNNNQDEKI